MLCTLLALFHLLLGNRPRRKSLTHTSSSTSSASTMANTERTFIMIKPDGIQRGLIGDIVKRFEQKGFKLVAMKFMQVRHLIAYLGPLYTGLTFFFTFLGL